MGDNRLRSGRLASVQTEATAAFIAFLSCDFALSFYSTHPHARTHILGTKLVAQTLICQNSESAEGARSLLFPAMQDFPARRRGGRFQVATDAFGYGSSRRSIQPPARRPRLHEFITTAKYARFLTRPQQYCQSITSVMRPDVVVVIFLRRVSFSVRLHRIRRWRNTEGPHAA